MNTDNALFASTSQATDTATVKQAETIPISRLEPCWVSAPCNIDSVAIQLTPYPKTGWQRFVSRISDLHFLAVPVVSVSPETLWAFGVAGAYYFQAAGQKRLSDIGFDAAYTLKGQWNVNINSTIYFGRSHDWTLFTRMGYRRYPDGFYGIGQQWADVQTRHFFVSDNVYFTSQPQCYITKSWVVGGDLVLYYEDARTADSIGHVNGLNEKILMLGVGGIVAYDTRDQVYYPKRGIYTKLTASYYGSALNHNAYQMGKISFDFRHYVPLYKELIFAYQFRSDWSIGKQKPFQMLSTLGGMDILRGLRRGQFRDDAYMVLQGELRFPIYKIIRGTVFAGVGDVYNLQHWQWEVPKATYGLGLRVAINKQKVNIRFDVAHDYIQGKYTPSSTYDWWRDGFSFYLTVKEAL